MVAVASLHAQTATLTIKVENILRVEGQVMIGLFKDANGFPEDREHMLAYKIDEVAGNQLILEFANLEPGNYAFSVVQDYNKNYKMDKNLLGMPKEPFGFSNDFEPLFSAPDFNDCKFTLTPGANVQTIQLIH